MRDTTETSEVKLRIELCNAIKDDIRGCVVLRHEDVFTSGVPDMSFTWQGRTTWIEAKYANPRPQGRGRQKITCCELEVAGRCRYVIWDENSGHRQTLIVRPRDVFRGNWREAIERAEGFDHQFIVEFLRRSHS